MRIPSIKTIQRIGCTEEVAKSIRSEMKGYYSRNPFNRPTPTITLSRIDALLGTYGVEFIREGRNSRSPAIDYCNTGDSYGCTVLWYNCNFHIGSWGDIVERGNYD